MYKESIVGNPKKVSRFLWVQGFQGVLFRVYAGPCGKRAFRFNVRAFIIRIRLWGILYDNYKKGTGLTQGRKCFRDLLSDDLGKNA